MSLLSNTIAVTGNISITVFGFFSAIIVGIPSSQPVISKTYSYSCMFTIDNPLLLTGLILRNTTWQRKTTMIF